MFPDGTGNVLYPSGNVAIMISSVAVGKYTYIVLDDAPDMASVLAIFDPSGFGTVYFLVLHRDWYYTIVLNRGLRRH